jgi:hypothetical protein
MGVAKKWFTIAKARNAYVVSEPGLIAFVAAGGVRIAPLAAALVLAAPVEEAAAAAPSKFSRYAINTDSASLKKHGVSIGQLAIRSPQEPARGFPPPSTAEKALSSSTWVISGKLRSLTRYATARPPAHPLGLALYL